ncbi:MAG: hypothetical protein NT033_02670 [Candidatus Omnitrophica bacterium]|nr:hypothetical protein [Candidatus Omnitrophota bacterium]
MKKIIFILIFLAVGATAYAHPPRDIKITFDPATKMLHAVIYHDVSNTINHYIKKVDVSLNGKEIIEQTISHQDNNNTQDVDYLIPDAKEGDTLAVEGHCSISGKLEKQITVKSEK